MRDRARPRTSLAFALEPARRVGLLEAVRRKFVGRLLLDGGTLEAPVRSTRGLEVPPPERRRSAR